jgi:hypothetical protein
MYKVEGRRAFAASRSNAGLALPLPTVMALSAFQPEVCDLKTDAIGVCEIRCPIVGGVIRVELCLRCIDAGATKLSCDDSDFVRRINAEAEVVQPRRVGVVCGFVTRWPKDITKMAVEILNVRIAAQSELVFAETQRL